MAQLPPEVLSNFKTLVDVEMKRLDDQVRDGMNRAMAEAAQRGMLQSGPILSEIVDMAARSVPTRAQFALNQMSRCLDAHGVTLDQDTGASAIEVLRQYLLHQCGLLRQIAAAAGPFQASGWLAGATSILDGIDKQVDGEIQRLGGETRLLVAQAERLKASAAKPDSAQSFESIRERASLANRTPPIAPEHPKEVVTLKPGIWGMSIDLKEAWRRFAAWLKDRRRSR